MLVAVAQLYADRGWSVIPIGPNKKPLIPWLEYCDRIATPAEISEWFTKYPGAQLGVITGEISGLSVIDVEAGGDWSIYPETVMSQTGGGGRHLFYKYNPLVRNAARVKPLTDLRGVHGFVVVAPSVSSKGPYTWLSSGEMAPFPIHLFPDIKEDTNPFRSGPTPMQNRRDWGVILDGAPEGQRNETAAKVIGKILRSIHPNEWDALAWPMIEAWNQKNRPPLPSHELRMVYESIQKRAVNDDRYEAPEVKKEKASVKAREVADTIEKVSWTEALDLGEKELLATRSEDCVSFGYDFLDDALTGFFPGELVLVGGITGSGKSTFAMNVMNKAASRGHRCLIFSLEDRLEDYAMKALFYKLCLLAKQLDGEKTVYRWNMFRRNLYKDDRYLELMAMAKKALANDNIKFIKVDGRLNFQVIEKIIDDECATGTSLFLIDHLHHLDLDSGNATRAENIENLLVDLRNAQRRNKARVMLVAHYKKTNGELPTLDSFKDSISLAQNASYVINIFRERGESHSERKKGKTLSASLKAFADTQDPRFVPTYFLIPKARNPNGEQTICVTFDKVTGDYLPTGAKEPRPLSDMKPKPPAFNGEE